MAIIHETTQRPTASDFLWGGEGPSVNKKQNKDLFNQILQQLRFVSDPKIPKSSQRDPELYVQRLSKIILNHPDRTIKAIALSMLGNNGAITTVGEELVTSETWDDLNLFKGAGTSGLSFADRIARTGTELGKGYLMGLIGRPTTNVYKLRVRQELIKNLMISGLAQHIATTLHLEKVQDGERQLISCWDEKIEYPSTIVKMFYRSQKQFDQLANSSPLALDLGSIYSHWKRISKCITQLSAGCCMIVHAVNTVVPFAPSRLTSYTKRVASKFIGTSGITCTITSMIPSRLVKATTYIAAGLIALRIINEFVWVKTDFTADKIIHKKFLAIATYLRAVKGIYSTLSQKPELTDCLEHFHKLEEFFENKNLSSLFTILESSTFNGEADLFFRRGNVLYLLEKFNKPEIRLQFESALTAVAEIDAFVSTAQLMKEFEDKRVQFCFPEYLEALQAPALHINDFWNVFVDPEKVVYNSVDFSESSAIRSHLITGPNGGGKTTILRSIAEDIILSQSLGIAAATHCSMPLFTFVASSMNISDSQGQESHFQAECIRINEIQQRLDALAKNQFAFIALDELYSGTSHEESTALACAILKDLGRNKKNVLSMVVTHDKDLTTLEDEQESGIKNFKVVVDTYTQPLFKIQEGTSDQHIALQVAKNKGLAPAHVQAAQQTLEILNGKKPLH